MLDAKPPETDPATHTDPSAPQTGSHAVENDEYTGALTRMIRALGRRAGQGDPYDLQHLLFLGRLADEQLGVAVETLRRDGGYSWADIGTACGMTRQAAQQRWGATSRGAS